MPRSLQRVVYSISGLLVAFLGTALLFKADVDDNRIVRSTIDTFQEEPLAEPLLFNIEDTTDSSIEKTLLPGETTLSDWLGRWRHAPSDTLLEEGIELARRRGERMRALVSADPGRAIDEMLSYREYLSLPPNVSELIEKPMAGFGDIQALSVCSLEHDTMTSPHRDEVHYTIGLGGRQIHLHLPEERKGIHSKLDVPILGIEIGDAAALHRQSVLKLSHDEAAAARELFDISGEDRGSGSRLLVGNQLWSLDTDLGEDSLNSRLIFAERQIGPQSVQVVLPLLKFGGDNTPLFYETLELAASSWSETPKSVLFVRLGFPDLSTSAGTKEAMESSLQNSSDRIREMSHGKTFFSSFEATAEAYVLPNLSSHYVEKGTGKLSGDATVLAENAGYDLSEFDIVGFVFPTISIGFRGVGTLGGQQLWINGTPNDSVITHEVGHNYGLGHASSWDANDGTIMPSEGVDRSTDAPQHIEYGDVFDIMGVGRFDEGDFNVFGKRYLNWIDDSKILTLNSLSDSVYRLYRFDHEDADSNPVLGLEIQVDRSETYWISHRRRYADNDILSNGVTIHWPYAHEPNTQRLLDMTPDSSSPSADKIDSALTIGSTFVDPTGLVTITPVERGGSGASEWIDVRVVVGVEGNNPPSVTLSGPGTGIARKPIVFTAEAIDPDGDALLYNWDFGDGKQAVGAAEIEHLFPAKGTFTVSVTVDDQKVGFANDYTEITISEPLEPWTVLEDKPVLYDILFDRGRFLGVGDNYGFRPFRREEHVYQSFDGANWTEIEVGNGITEIEPIIKDDYGYLLVARRPEVLFDGLIETGSMETVIVRSKDGLNWEVEEIPNETLGFRSVAYGNGVWIAVSNSERIYRKASIGSSWELLDTDALIPFGRVVFGDGVFMIGGSQNTLLRSVDDGLSWVDISDKEGVSNLPHLSRIYYGNGLFLIGGSGIIVSSNLGETWIHAEGSNKPESHLVFSFGDDFIHAASSTHDYFSVDGIHWGRSPRSPQSSRSFSKAVFGNGIFLQIGRDSENILPFEKEGVYRISNASEPSADPAVTISGPEQLTARTPAELTATAVDSDSDVLYFYWDIGDGVFRPGGDSISINPQAAGLYTFKVAVSDGAGGLEIATLQRTVLDPLDPWTTSESVDGLDYSDAIYHEGRFLATGTNGVYSSPDGFNWSEIELKYELNGISAGNYGYAVVGESYEDDSETGNGVIFLSRDGVSWIEEDLPPGIPALTAIAYGDDSWIAVGKKGTILTKGVFESKWVKVSLGSSFDLRDIAFGDGVFMVVGAVLKTFVDPLGNSYLVSNGEVLSISNNRGYSWEDRSRFSSSTFGRSYSSLSEVAYAAGKFIVGGTSGVSVSHDDGDTWEGGPSRILREPGTRAVHPSNPMALAANDEFIFAASQHGRYFSSDGIEWNSTHVEDDRVKTAAAFGLGKIIVVGESGYRSVSSGFYENEAPSVVLSGPSEMVAQLPYAYSVEVSDSDSDAFFYFWDLGDGILRPGAETRVILNQTAGNRIIRVLVSDGNGGLAEASIETNTVDPADPGSMSNPVISLSGPEELKVLNAALFEIEATDDDPDQLNFYWDEGDGLWLEGDAQREITPTNVGNLTIRVMVMNLQGGVSHASRDFHVPDGNSDPVVELNDPPDGYVGQSIPFSASVFDKNGDTLNLTWDFGDGTIISGSKVQSHTYQNEGVFRAAITADDLNGGISLDTFEVSIRQALDPQSQILIWLAERLPGIDPELQGIYRDPDYDGMNNLAEYVFGLDPNFPDASQSFIFRDSNQLTLRLRTNDPSIRLTHLITNDFESWDVRIFQYDEDSTLWRSRTEQGVSRAQSSTDLGDGIRTLNLIADGKVDPMIVKTLIEFNP